MLYALLAGSLALVLLPFFFCLSLCFSLPPRFRQRFWPVSQPLHPKEGALVWVHALSLGEVLSALPLMEALHTVRGLRLVMTVSTRSGMEAATRALSGKVEALRYFPLDHPLAVSRILRDLSPDFFVLVETDLWPFFMYRLGRKGIPSLWMNVRISDKTLTGYARFSSLMYPAMARFRAVMPQSPEDARRLSCLGLPPSRILPWGNAKHDRALPDPRNPDLSELRCFIEKRRADFIWICGSLHPGEEGIVAQTLGLLKNENLLTLVVPRHPDKSLLLEKGFAAGGQEAFIFSAHPPEAASLILVDQMGLLADLYALGDAAFVGGSLVPLRGHNPLEPAMAGIPVLMGPHTEDFTESWRGLCDRGAAFEIRDATGMADQLLYWMRHAGARQRAGDCGKAFVLEGKGAVARAVSFVLENLEKR